MSWDLRSLEFEPPAHPEALADVKGLLDRLERAFGDEPLARLLNVEAGVVSDCMAGNQQMSDEVKRRVINLHDVLNRAFQVFAPDTAVRWLLGSEPFLGGSRPIDFLAVHGAGAVIEALDCTDAGGYA
jgi:hypothetical protein